MVYLCQAPGQSNDIRFTLVDPDAGNLLPSLHGSYLSFKLLRSSSFCQVIPPVSVALALVNPDAEIPSDNYLSEQLE